MKLTHFVLTLFLACGFAGFAFAQKIEQKPFEVRVNVNVTDAAGNPVGDVKLEDLKVFEDGVEQKITYFVKKEPTLNLGLIFDNTGSMRIQLDTITATGKSIVENLRAGDEAFEVRFVDSETTTVWEDWSSDKARLKKGIENLYIEGGQSSILDAVYLASTKILAREKKDASKRCALILITDGEDRKSYVNLQQTLALLKDSGMQIFVLGLVGDFDKSGRQVSEDFSNRLAFATGGTAFFIKNSLPDKAIPEAAEALKSLMTELRSQYVIGYTSTNQKRNGKPRTLRIEAAGNEKGEKRQGTIRANFVVPKD
ncbi:MAG: VWA domain-containing protein [Pyrinomonadaceae bacterium]